MAHKKDKKSRVISPQRTITQSVPETRGHLVTARANLARRFHLSNLLHAIAPIQTRLQQAEDLRRVPHEFRQERYLLRSGQPARVRYETVQTNVRGHLRTQVHPYFRQPERTAVCIRRKERRRVLFALQKTGKGGRRQRPPRWTEKSYIRCR